MVINTLSFCLSEKIFILSSFLKDSCVMYIILGWQFFLFQYFKYIIILSPELKFLLGNQWITNDLFTIFFLSAVKNTVKAATNNTVPPWYRIYLQCRWPGFNPWVGKIPGEGNSNPLQYSCQENSMDRGAWQATVHGVSKSWTWQSDWAQG